MPKSQVIEEKYINGIKVDKENDNCFFNDETHTYYDKKTMRKCISVTQLISHYCTEFDENFWSAYKALEFICEPDVWSIIRGRLLSTKRFTDVTLEYLEKTYHIDRNLFLIKQEEIKAEYKKKRDEACERGTKIHLGRELSMYGKKDFDFRPYGFKDLYGQFFCYQDHSVIELERGVYPEFLIYADFDGLLVSGQADLLICDGLDVYLGDYKTNREIKKTSYFDQRRKKYQMMKPPLNNIMDSTFNHYALQLSLYGRMLQQNDPKLNIKQLQIIHIDHDNNETIYEVPYLKSDVERMLKHYTKQQEIQEKLDRDRPVII